METRKLTLAVTAESMADAVASLRADGIDDDTRRVRDLAFRVYDTVRDPEHVSLVLADSGRVVSHQDLFRVAAAVDLSAARKTVAGPLADSLLLHSGPEHLVAVCNTGESPSAIPSGWFPDHVETLLPVAGLNGGTTVRVDRSVSARDLMTFFCSHAHPFTDALLIDQYLMNKSDNFLQAGFAPMMKALLSHTTNTRARITLLDTSKRFDQKPASHELAGVAEGDRRRLAALIPDAEWSAVFLDLDAPALIQRASVRARIAKATHDRVLITNTMLVKSGYGFAVADGGATPSRTRDGEVLLAATSYDVDVALESAGRKALLGYVAEICESLERCVAVENAVGVAGSISENRLLAQSVR